MSDNMNAYVAEADGSDVLLDKDGTLWVHLRDDAWAYVTDGNRLCWDMRDRLPVDYEPYRSLDSAASSLVLTAILKRV